MTLFVILLGLVMLAAEQIRPARGFPRIPGWWPRALALNAVQVASVYAGGVLWDDWFARHRLWSAAPLGLWGSAVVGYVVDTFFFYWWHRWRHEVPFLWRWFHQIHHSPERIEVITAFYKHPFEIVGDGILTSAILYLGVGLDAPAAALAVVFMGVAEFFYHWNVKTPRWVGYFIQRPESHCIHHQAGLHARNYADLPVWDMLFGTFENPRAWNARCGFGDGRERRLVEMLRGVDVNAERREVAA